MQAAIFTPASHSQPFTYRIILRSGRTAQLKCNLSLVTPTQQQSAAQAKRTEKYRMLSIDRSLCCNALFGICLSVCWFVCCYKNLEQPSKQTSITTNLSFLPLTSDFPKKEPLFLSLPQSYAAAASHEKQ